jgi:hypothetical protein
MPFVVVLLCFVIFAFYSRACNTVFALLDCGYKEMDITTAASLNGMDEALAQALVRENGIVEVLTLKSNIGFACYRGAHLFPAILAWITLFVYCLGLPVWAFFWARRRIREYLSRLPVKLTRESMNPDAAANDTQVAEKRRKDEVYFKSDSAADFILRTAYRPAAFQFRLIEMVCLMLLALVSVVWRVSSNVPSIIGKASVTCFILLCQAVASIYLSPHYSDELWREPIRLGALLIAMLVSITAAVNNISQFNPDRIPQTTVNNLAIAVVIFASLWLAVVVGAIFWSLIQGAKTEAALAAAKAKLQGASTALRGSSSSLRFLSKIRLPGSSDRDLRKKSSNAGLAGGGENYDPVKAKQRIVVRTATSKGGPAFAPANGGVKAQPRTAFEASGTMDFEGSFSAIAAAGGGGGGIRADGLGSMDADQRRRYLASISGKGLPAASEVTSTTSSTGTAGARKPEAFEFAMQQLSGTSGDKAGMSEAVLAHLMAGYHGGGGGGHSKQQKQASASSSAASATTEPEEEPEDEQEEQEPEFPAAESKKAAPETNAATAGAVTNPMSAATSVRRLRLSMGRLSQYLGPSSASSSLPLKADAGYSDGGSFVSPSATALALAVATGRGQPIDSAPASQRHLFAGEAKKKEDSTIELQPTQNFTRQGRVSSAAVPPPQQQQQQRQSVMLLSDAKAMPPPTMLRLTSSSSVRRPQSLDVASTSSVVPVSASVMTANPLAAAAAATAVERPEDVWTSAPPTREVSAGTGTGPAGGGGGNGITNEAGDAQAQAQQTPMTADTIASLMAALASLTSAPEATTSSLQFKAAANVPSAATATTTTARATMIPQHRPIPLPPAASSSSSAPSSSTGPMLPLPTPPPLRLAAGSSATASGGAPIPFNLPLPVPLLPLQPQPPASTSRADMAE